MKKKTTLKNSRNGKRGGGYLFAWMIEIWKVLSEKKNIHLLSYNFAEKNSYGLEAIILEMMKRVIFGISI
jgi:hypothetical protein